MAQISSFEDIKRTDRRRKRLWRGFWLAITILLCFFVYMQKESIQSMGFSGWVEELLLRGSQDNFPMSIPTSDDKQIVSLGSQIAITQKGEISLYSLIGENLETNRITFQRPLSITCDKRLITMELGGYGLRIEERGEVILDTTFSNPILGGAASVGGLLAITTAHDRYSSRVEVFDKSLNNFFSYNSSEHTIVASALSEKKLAVAGITTQNGQLSTRVVLNALNGKDDEVVVELGNEMIFYMNFLSDGHLLLLTDKSVQILSSIGTAVSKYSYSDPLASFTEDGNGGVWLVEGDYTRTHQNKIIHLGKDLKVNGTIELGQSVTKLIAYRGSLLVISPDGVRKFNNRYEAVETIPVRNAMDATMVDKYLYLVTGDSLHRYVVSR